MSPHWQRVFCNAVVAHGHRHHHCCVQVIPDVSDVYVFRIAELSVLRAGALFPSGILDASDQWHCLDRSARVGAKDHG